MTSRIEGARSGPTARDINLRDTRCSRRQLPPSSHHAPLSPRLTEKSTLHNRSTMVALIAHRSTPRANPAWGGHPEPRLSSRWPKVPSTLELGVPRMFSSTWRCVDGWCIRTEPPPTSVPVRTERFSHSLLPTPPVHPCSSGRQHLIGSEATRASDANLCTNYKGQNGIAHHCKPNRSTARSQFPAPLMLAPLPHPPVPVLKMGGASLTISVGRAAHRRY
jgi:hypothetical protein